MRARMAESVESLLHAVASPDLGTALRALRELHARPDHVHTQQELPHQLCRVLEQHGAAAASAALPLLTDWLRSPAAGKQPLQQRIQPVQQQQQQQQLYQATQCVLQQLQSWCHVAVLPPACYLPTAIAFLAAATEALHAAASPFAPELREACVAAACDALVLRGQQCVQQGIDWAWKPEPSMGASSDAAGCRSDASEAVAALSSAVAQLLVCNLDVPHECTWLLASFLSCFASPSHTLAVSHPSHISHVAPSSTTHTSGQISASAAPLMLRSLERLADAGIISRSCASEVWTQVCMHGTYCVALEAAGLGTQLGTGACAMLVSAEQVRRQQRQQQPKPWQQQQQQGAQQPPTKPWQRQQQPLANSSSLQQQQQQEAGAHSPPAVLGLDPAAAGGPSARVPPEPHDLAAGLSQLVRLLCDTMTASAADVVTAVAATAPQRLPPAAGAIQAGQGVAAAPMTTAAAALATPTGCVSVTHCVNLPSRQPWPSLLPVVSILMASSLLEALLQSGRDDAAVAAALKPAVGMLVSSLQTTFATVCNPNAPATGQATELLLCQLAAGHSFAHLIALPSLSSSPGAASGTGALAAALAPPGPASYQLPLMAAQLLLRGPIMPLCPLLTLAASGESAVEARHWLARHALGRGASHSHSTNMGGTGRGPVNGRAGMVGGGLPDPGLRLWKDVPALAKCVVDGLRLAQQQQQQQQQAGRLGSHAAGLQPSSLPAAMALAVCSSAQLAHEVYSALALIVPPGWLQQLDAAPATGGATASATPVGGAGLLRDVLDTLHVSTLSIATVLTEGQLLQQHAAATDATTSNTNDAGNTSSPAPGASLGTMPANSALSQLQRAAPASPTAPLTAATALMGLASDMAFCRVPGLGLVEGLTARLLPLFTASPHGAALLASTLPCYEHLISPVTMHIHAPDLPPSSASTGARWQYDAVLVSKLLLLLPMVSSCLPAAADPQHAAARLLPYALLLLGHPQESAQRTAHSVMLAVLATLTTHSSSGTAIATTAATTTAAAAAGDCSAENVHAGASSTNPSACMELAASALPYYIVRSLAAPAPAPTLSHATLNHSDASGAGNPGFAPAAMSRGRFAAPTLVGVQGLASALPPLLKSLPPDNACVRASIQGLTDAAGACLARGHLQGLPDLLRGQEMGMAPDDLVPDFTSLYQPSAPAAGPGPAEMGTAAAAGGAGDAAAGHVLKQQIVEWRAATAQLLSLACSLPLLVAWPLMPLAAGCVERMLLCPGLSPAAVAATLQHLHHLLLRSDDYERKGVLSAWYVRLLQRCRLQDERESMEGGVAGAGGLQGRPEEGELQHALPGPVSGAADAGSGTAGTQGQDGAGRAEGHTLQRQRQGAPAASVLHTAEPRPRFMVELV